MQGSDKDSDEVASRLDSNPSLVVHSPATVPSVPVALGVGAVTARPNPLRIPHFRTVWIGAFGSSIGGWMEFVGISWIITTTTDQPAKWLGLHAAAQLVPMMVLGIPAGVLADRVNRRTLLLVTQGMMMLIAMALTVMAYRGSVNLTALMTLTALLGTTMAFNVPAWQVLTPRLVPREQLQDAIVMMGLQFNIARVVGPALGGVLMGWGGPQMLFLVNTISFVGVMFAVWLTPDAPAPARVGPSSVVRETLEGLAFTLGSAGPRCIVLGHDHLWLASRTSAAHVASLHQFSILHSHLRGSRAGVSLWTIAGVHGRWRSSWRVAHACNSALVSQASSHPAVGGAQRGCCRRVRLLGQPHYWRSLPHSCWRRLAHKL